ncbi:ImmA/IrrE family metallo-endopeptidase [Faecalibacter bovis]|uniref:ImmA/IrrE family metallo-endopeptidase n=1 Tax=Faecalibacter bovis TaxID=2898187 RepID=A0ABX7XFY1_9FLAO|nr:ImmA/IrrE family metallo-endopeptidase [Faecalibacter bovis]QTV06746.1 ImmA/IrrE family metallo-endopeptidase [Faecalibacter bovis]
MAISKEVSNATKQFIINNEQFFNEAPVIIDDIISHFNIQKKEYAFEDDISGVLIIDKSKDKFTIGINKQGTDQRKNFTIAHELGHFVLHNNDMSNTFVDNIFFRKKADGYTSKEEKIEKEANYFAANILMPEHLVKKEIANLENDWFEDDAVAELAKKFNVSSSAMMYRLINLKLI